MFLSFILYKPITGSLLVTIKNILNLLVVTKFFFVFSNTGLLFHKCFKLPVFYVLCRPTRNFIFSFVLVINIF